MVIGNQIFVVKRATRHSNETSSAASSQPGSFSSSAHCGLFANPDPTINQSKVSIKSWVRLAPFPPPLSALFASNRNLLSMCVFKCVFAATQTHRCTGSRRTPPPPGRCTRRRRFSCSRPTQPRRWSTSAITISRQGRRWWWSRTGPRWSTTPPSSSRAMMRRQSRATGSRPFRVVDTTRHQNRATGNRPSPVDTMIRPFPAAAATTHHRNPRTETPRSVGPATTIEKIERLKTEPKLDLERKSFFAAIKQ